MTDKWRLGVADTSPLIALGAIERLDLLIHTFEQIIIPGKVWNELTDKPNMPEPQALQQLDRITFELRTFAPPEQASKLHAGERHVIGIAYQQGATALLDERPARKVARDVGLQTVGVLGILLQGKRFGHVEVVEPLVRRLQERGFRLPPAYVRRVLAVAGERSE